MNEIVVTGLGVICAIGNNVPECLDAFRQKRSGIGEVHYLKSVHQKQFPMAEVKQSNSQLMENLDLDPEENTFMSRTTLLAMHAAKEALEMAEKTNGKVMRTGLVSSTTVGGMDITEQNYLKNETDKSYLKSHPCGDSTLQVAKILNADSYYTTLNTACSSAANAVIHGVRLLKHNILDRVIVGGVDALSMFTLNGFNSLMILDEEPCKPFDEDRKGLNLGEGAGYIVLERKKEAKDYLCRLSGYANSNDAYHQTASSPEGDGAYKSMYEALKMSGLDLNSIDYINVHGTGTPNNDLSEGTAMKRLFSEGKIPPFSSTKSFTGHTLAGSAGIEAVFSVMSIVYDIIYPNLRFTKPVEGLNLFPCLDVKEGSGVKNVMSNSFGFGGNSSTLIFSM